jgi:hypothetical protein
MELEVEMGFRSSFNFIPEGSYRLPVTLRQELVDNGFEIGVTICGTTVDSFARPPRFKPGLRE